MKRTLAFLLALCLIFGQVPAAVFAAEIVASGTCGKNLTWTLSDDGVLTISGDGPMQNYSYASSNKAPWYGNRSSVKSLIIDDSVTTIGYCAFCGCTSLSRIPFTGDAPSFESEIFSSVVSEVFSSVSATACYPANNPTWTLDVMLNYGGTITWTAD